MGVNEKFHPIEKETWPRAKAFEYFTQMAPTTYSATIMMDVTVLRKTLKERKIKFFPAYLYLVTRAVNKQQELKIGFREGVLGWWESLTPAYPQFHEDDKTNSLLWTEYDESFEVFYKRYLLDTQTYGDSHGILTSKGIPFPNSYCVSCIPWLPFHSFSLHNHGIKDYYFPNFEAGKFVESQGKIWMPLSITVHHATTDGYHVHVFFEELRQLMENPQEWLWERTI